MDERVLDLFFEDLLGERLLRTEQILQLARDCLLIVGIGGDL